ncbi:MAG: inositol monophosphatase family protein, partial [Parvularcula sp.]
VDPVDGTINFVEGSDRFGVMVALVVRGETQAGWIYSPVPDELAVAVRGGGATLDGATLPARAIQDFENARGDYSARFVPEPLRTQISKCLAPVPDIQQGHCSAHAYLDTARGKLDFVVQYLMTPWDHAAGTLMVEETGGTSRFLDDESPYTAVPREARLMLSVCNEGGWASYRDVLRGAIATP